MRLREKFEEILQGPPFALGLGASTTLETQLGVLASLVPLKEKEAELMARVRRLENDKALLDLTLKEQHADHMFGIDTRILRGAFDGVFDGASKRLLETHAAMAEAAWNTKTSIQDARAEWEHLRQQDRSRPTDLVPSLAVVLPSELDLAPKVASDENEDDQDNDDDDDDEVYGGGADEKTSPAPDSKTARDPDTKDVKSGVENVKCGDVDVKSGCVRPLMQWAVSEAELHSASTAAVCNASQMTQMLKDVEAFAESKVNPFRTTAERVRPILRDDVLALLQAWPLAELDVQMRDILYAMIYTPAMDLLRSPLQPAFREGRASYGAQLQRVASNGEKIAMAENDNDLKQVVALEEAQTVATRRALAENAALRALLSDPKHAELYLNGDTGKLATLRAEVAGRFGHLAADHSAGMRKHQTDVETLERLRESVSAALVREATRAAIRQTEARRTIVDRDAEFRALSTAEAWNFADEAARLKVINSARVREAEAGILLEKTQRANALVTAAFDARAAQLARFGQYLDRALQVQTAEIG